MSDQQQPSQEDIRCLAEQMPCAIKSGQTVVEAWNEACAAAERILKSRTIEAATDNKRPMGRYRENV